MVEMMNDDPADGSTDSRAHDCDAPDLSQRSKVIFSSCDKMLFVC